MPLTRPSTPAGRGPPRVVGLLAVLLTSTASSSAAAAAPAPTTERAPAVEGFTLEVPLVLTASAPASNVGTSLVPWLSVRAGALFPLAPGGSAWGFDVALLGSWARDGTNAVAATRALLAVEGRGLVSPGRLSSTYSAFVPYGFVGLLGGGGVVDIEAFKDSRVGALGTWGARAGAGGRVEIHQVTTTLELAAGVRDLKLEVSSSFAIGVRF